jgi:hypothetical protein
MRRAWLISFMGVVLGASVAIAQNLPDGSDMRAWSGLPEGLKLEARDMADSDAKVLGKFLRGRIYSSPKTRYSYCIAVFSAGDLMRDRREEFVEIVKRLAERKKSPGDLQSGERTFMIGAQLFYVVPMGAGPGGGSLIAIAFTPKYDVIVQESLSEEGHPLDKTRETGPEPTIKLPDLFRRVFQRVMEPVPPK